LELLMPNDFPHVQRLLRLLESHGIATWLCGGWAEELHGLIAPRPHRDIDLLYRADDFALVDRFLQQAAFEEIVAKRFPPKRAFLVEGVMTEVVLVRPDLTTLFWSQHQFAWPVDVFSAEEGSIRLASVAALAAYRRAYHRLPRSFADQ
jgi:hypothetical protein